MSSTSRAGTSAGSGDADRPTRSSSAIPEAPLLSARVPREKTKREPLQFVAATGGGYGLYKDAFEPKLGSECIVAEIYSSCLLAGCGLLNYYKSNPKAHLQPETESLDCPCKFAHFLLFSQSANSTRFF